MTPGPALRDLLASGRPTYSFEIFPSKHGANDPALWQTVLELEPLKPTFVSVTYGAGGSTQERTLDICRRIEEQTGMSTVGHLTCVDSSVDALRAVIRKYVDAGVRSVLALRGDPTAGPNTSWVTHPNGFRYAIQLVELLRELGDFTIGVAAFPEKHPESPSMQHDSRILAEKQRAGAHYAITQLFFRPVDYFALVDRAHAAGVTMPIIPGIMPVTNVAQIERFASLSGAEFPVALRERFEAVRDDEQGVREVGVDIAFELSVALVQGGAPGLHFYTMNKSASTRRVFQRLADAGIIQR
ncbi:MAG: methylenetetrahydrofolate reductase [NAD(P)H] [Candidatus Nanopelagicales bacterium]